MMILVLAKQELRLWCDWFEWTMELIVQINTWDAVTARVPAQKDPATIVSNNRVIFFHLVT